jgi:O-antigen/teichoic acid export membrane protein
MLIAIMFTVSLVYYENKDIYIYTILLAFIPFAQIANIFGYFFIATKRSKDFAIPNIINSVIFFFIKILTIYFYKNIILFISISVIEALFLSLVLYIKFSKSMVNFSFSVIFLDIKKTLKKSIPLAIAASGFMLCTKIDLFMISKILDIKTAGLYAVSTKITESFSFIFLTLLLSIFSQMTSNKNLKYAPYFKKIFFSTTLISAIIYFFSSNIIDYFFGIDYVDSIMPLKILIWSILFFTLYSFMSQISLLNNKIIYIVYSSIIMLILNIIFNYLLIPKYLMAGAAFSSLISLVLGCIFLYSFIKKNAPNMQHSIG